MKRFLFTMSFLICFLQFLSAGELPASRNYFELRVYHFVSNEQEIILDDFFQHALIPALHRNNRKLIGVFKPLANDTAADKKIYVLIPHQSLKDFTGLGKKLQSDTGYLLKGAGYINAPYDKPAYSRMESILLYAFEGMQGIAKPQLSGSRMENVYELRSYEGHTEKIFQNKVDMFNKGDEVGLFKKLNFNAVFYSEVIAGSKMPNLMYMTSFNNMKERDEHWKAFGSHPDWIKLKSDPAYQNNVSKNEITFLRAAAYSDL
ncbi:MAG: NIPSNAP family protein [Bacteroidota bacterium]